jgi:hypothetical protein
MIKKTPEYGYVFTVADSNSRKSETSNFQETNLRFEHHCLKKVHYTNQKYSPKLFILLNRESFQDFL